MSRAVEARGTEEFASLLRELKDRSGLSYGALAKRLHMSTSTLHRYCNGTAVPNEYAPVERFARVCRATPQELVELHRRWILADAARAQRAERAAATRAAAESEATTSDARTLESTTAESTTADSTAGSTPGPVMADSPTADSPTADTTEDSPQKAVSAADSAEPVSAASDERGAGDGPGEPDVPGTPGAPGSPGAPGDPGDPVVVNVAREPARPRRRRTALIASAAAAVVLGAVALTVIPHAGGDGNDARDGQAAGASAAGGTADAEEPKKPTGTPSPSAPSRTPSASATASATGSGKGGSDAPQDGGEQDAPAEPTGGGDTGGVPVIVGTRPYVYDSPCSQHFLVDSEPEQVGPPASEQDAPRWAAALGAVSSGEQRVALTLQGTGADTVVLEALHVRVVAKGAPLAWNDYSMGVGCGGGVETRSFDIDLDNGSPTVAVKNGQRDFPYKVSESDPEVFYVTARTKAHDVRWDLTLDWSSGSRRGTLHIDNNGTPFRTSGNVGRPGYDYPLGGSDWIVREEG
ncbi:helix-turn-helix domain-containing protein [Streptomyces sp. NPDC095613]|uniref:helix-turn-helix domain-containing protein n=1 Tax=Streptomyces sp. NPDC095613 TaxID=3155540 RepID=UPI0033278648